MPKVVKEAAAKAAKSARFADSQDFPLVNLDAAKPKRPVKPRLRKATDPEPQSYQEIKKQMKPYQPPPEES